ncbi:hypothetical protein DITRI_Ditri20bG0096200 [Diplodiscus trichospermus]
MEEENCDEDSGVQKESTNHKLEGENCDESLKGKKRRNARKKVINGQHLASRKLGNSDENHKMEEENCDEDSGVQKESTNHKLEGENCDESLKGKKRRNARKKVINGQYLTIRKLQNSDENHKMEENDCDEDSGVQKESTNHKLGGEN